MVPAPAVEPATRVGPRGHVAAQQVQRAALGAFLAFLVLAPRLLATDVFVTTDELFWLGRSGTFARALNQGRFDQTFLSGHPGVTTMWSAVVSLGLERAQQFAGPRREVSRREVSQHPDFMAALARARLGVGMVTGLAALAMAALVWRLFGPLSGTLAAGLLAFEPFLLAHSRLLHIDAELASFIGLALLAAIAGWTGRLGSWVMLMSGVATGLALLAKAPASILLGFIPLLGLALLGPSALRSPRTWILGALWALSALATYLAVWPAMWTSAGSTLGQVLAFMRDNTNPPHALGPIGEERASVGPLFYVHTLLLRTSPITLAGLVLALVACLMVPGRERRVWRHGTAAILGFAVLFGLLMTFAAKNFDRYLLPVFPLLAVVSGFGWAAALRAVALRSRGLTAILATIVLGAHAALTFATAPYYLTYFNPLAGGAERGTRLIASGWGEGLDRVAEYLDGQNNASRLRVGLPGEIYTTVLGAQTSAQVTPADAADATAYDYLVVYIRNRQLGESAPAMDERHLPWQPEQVVRVHGIDYAWIYDTRQGAPVRVHLGSDVMLHGYTTNSVRIRPGQTLQLTLFLEGSMADSIIEARLLNVAGQVVAHQQIGGTTSGAVRVMLSTAAEAESGEYVLSTRIVDSLGRPLVSERTSADGWLALRGIELRAERR